MIGFELFVCRIDAGVGIAPAELVGRQVRVLWPHEGAWFLGSVSGYNLDDGKHEVGMHFFPSPLQYIIFTNVHSQTSWWRKGLSNVLRVFLHIVV